MTCFYRNLTICFVLFILLFNARVSGQIITSVNPGVGYLGSALTVSVSGQSTNFGQGTSTTFVWFSQGSSTIINSDAISVVNSTLVTAKFTFSNVLPTGFYDVNVYNDFNGLMTMYNGFYLNPNPNPPKIISANPASANQGQTLGVTISGQNTNFGQGSSTTSVWFQQGSSTIYPYVYNFVNATTINALFKIPSNALPGYYDVNGFNYIDGYMTLPGGFLVGAVGITELNEKLNVLIYPNPSNGKFNVTINSPLTTHHSQIHVYNELGEKIYTTAIHNLQSTLDISSYPQGIYFVKLFVPSAKPGAGGEEIYTGKILKQ